MVLKAAQVELRSIISTSSSGSRVLSERPEFDYAVRLGMNLAPVD